jgi:putative ABC transport system substrate-binding protein
MATDGTPRASLWRCLTFAAASAMAAVLRARARRVLITVGATFVLGHGTAWAVDPPSELPARAQEPAKPRLQLAQISEQIKRTHGASAEPIGVIFPDIGEPYRKVFTEIMEGIEDQTKLRVRGYPVASNQDVNELSNTLKRNGTKVVIALGRQGLRAAGSMDWPVGVVVGGVSSVPDGEKQVGITLTPDPALLFLQLKNLLPGIKRVIVVYNPAYNEWLVKLARDAARSQGIELVAHEARDLASAARLYEAAFAATDSRHDAVWLPIDATTVDESTILPIVLRESWNRSVPIFSSSFLHVKKGALFALYPNNVELGRNLASLAVAMLTGDNLRRGVTPLREVYAALNLRTASHIGLNIGTRVQRGFDFLFPEP